MPLDVEDCVVGVVLVGEVVVGVVLVGEVVAVQGTHGSVREYTIVGKVHPPA